MKGIMIVFVLFLALTSVAQEERGILCTSYNLEIVKEKYTRDNRIVLDSLRKTTDFLTNRDLRLYDSLILPKRKKAFMRHVKHLSEQLEEYCFDERNWDLAAGEMLVELEYLRRYFITKAEFNAHPFPTREEQIAMGKTSRKSRKYFVVEDHDASVGTIRNTPYWHHVDSVPHKRFKYLAKAKKVKAHSKRNMPVLFEELSYTGSAPKIRTLDMDLDNEWALKWGDEVHTDVAASRLFAALGFDVDHPYFYGAGKLTLIFDSTKAIYNWDQLRDSVFNIYKVDIQPYLLEQGRVTDTMIGHDKELLPYKGNRYVRFLKCGLEARPDRVKRLGSFLPDEFGNEFRTEIQGALLAHVWIGNWDTREENTLLTQVHNGKYEYRISAVYSDLGTSFGVKLNMFPADFKVGLVNEFDWKAASRKGDKVRLHAMMNTILEPYEHLDYTDLEWMALRIAEIDSLTLRKCINKAKWPGPIEELYFHKMAARRASILEAFEIDDPHPIPYDRKLTIVKKGKKVIRRGKLVVDYKRKKNPESFLKTKGRKRNYGV